MPSIGAKADHVRGRIAQGRAGNHHCHWPGCERKVPPAQWGCRPHWFALPTSIRNKIWRAYRIGQEDTKTPNAAYILAAREAQDWIRTHAQRWAAPKPSPPRQEEKPNDQPTLPNL